MKTSNYFFIVILILLSLNQNDLNSKECVVVCTGPYAYAYHGSDNCRGLNRCSRAIITISLQEAKSMGRRPCGICGGYPFNCGNIGNNDDCEEKIEETKRTYQNNINQLEKKTANEVKTNLDLNEKNKKLKTENQHLARMNKALNSPFKNPDSLLMATYQFIEDREKFDESKSEFEKASVTRKKELEKYHDSLNKLYNEIMIDRMQNKNDLALLDNEKQNLKLKEVEYETRYKSSLEILTNADKLNSIWNEKKRDIELKAESVQNMNRKIEIREKQISEDLNRIHDDRNTLNKDIQIARYIYPERFAFEIVSKPLYCISNSTFKTGAIDLACGLLWRYDVNRTLYSQNDRVNKIGIVYSYKSELNYKSLSNIGYLQSLNLIFDFQEVLRTGIGYSFLKSQSIQKTDGIINIPFQLFFTRYPILVGISSNINFNNRFTYINTEIGLCLGIGFDFLRF